MLIPMKQMMRIAFTAFVILMSVLSSSGSPVMDPTVIHFPVIPVPKEEEPIIPNPPIKHRLPSRMLTVSISSDGSILIDGIAEEILTYEILDEQESTMGIFYDSLSFTATLFSLQGDYEIRLVTDEYIYTGYVWME